jgi:pyrimidine operon attenuation protein/uracil phosphoribosyltransferase
MLTDIQAKNYILTAETAKRMIRRMALQIAENNWDEKEIIIAGITGNGIVVADKIIAELKYLSFTSIKKNSISLDKKNPLDARIDLPQDFTSKIIIVVDDVSNTGKTLLYALKPFVTELPKKIQTLVLVERSHKLFAVQPDYVGLSVATTLREHISVGVEGDEIAGAWLE